MPGTGAGRDRGRQNAALAALAALLTGGPFGDDQELFPQ